VTRAWGWLMAIVLGVVFLAALVSLVMR